MNHIFNVISKKSLSNSESQLVSPILSLDFPGGSVVNNSSANAGGSGLIPGSGRSLGEGNGNPLRVEPGKSHGQRSLEGCSPWGHNRVRHNSN